MIVIGLSLILASIAGSQEVAYNPSGLEWTANGEADLAGYNVYEKAGDGAYELLASCTPELTRLDFSEATPHPDGSYTWVVTAYDKAGNESGYSEDCSAEFDSGPPAAPTGVVTVP
jgi:hypothetical protein